MSYRKIHSQLLNKTNSKPNKNNSKLTLSTTMYHSHHYFLDIDFHQLIELYLSCSINLLSQSFFQNKRKGMNVNQNILNKNRPFRFQLLGMQRIVQIIVEFKIQGIMETKSVKIHSSSMTFPVLKNNVQKLQNAYIANKVPIDRLVKFVKNGRKFIPFNRLQQKDQHQLLSKQQIHIQYLYKTKRDQFQRKLVNLQNQATQQHELLKEIVQQEKARTRTDVLKKLASNDSGLQAQNVMQVKIRIILYISDPLVKMDKEIPASSDELNIEDHVNILQLSSNLSQSLSISVQRAYAYYDSGKINIHSVLQKGQKSRINIVHFFVNVIKNQDEVFLIFEGRNNLFGKQVMFKAKEFFYQVKNSAISLLIFIGTNVDLLKQIIPNDLQFSTLLLTTYSPNKQEGFKSLIRVFYEHLFNRYELNESVDIAIKQHKRLYLNINTWKKNYGCCCLHQHKDNCAWIKIVELIGKGLGHKIFFHNDLRSGNVKEKIHKFQTKILEYFLIQDQKCGDGIDYCCQTSHKIRQSIQMNKKIPFYPKSMSPIFQNSQSSQKFKNNVFHVKFLSDKTFQSSHQFRRCPLRIFQIVNKIIQEKNKIIQIVGSRRIGKGQFIQAGCKYILNRDESYCFEDVDQNQSTLKECLHKIFTRAQILKQQKQKKNIVFIHHNKGMMIEKQNIKQFYQNSKGKLPFTFLVKLNSPYEQKSPSSSSNHPSTITIPKLKKLQIFCEIFHQIRHKSFYQDIQILSQVFDFCDRYNEKITFKEIRTFLQQQYKVEKISWTEPGKTLLDKWKLFGDEFSKKIESLQSKNKKLYDFLGFISLFPEGFYLTKLTEHLVKQILDIQHPQELIKAKEITGLYFEIYHKPIRVRKISTKVQRNDFIIPNDKIINFFRTKNLKKYHQMKLDFFHGFFNLMEAIIFKYEHILRKVQKRQRSFLEEGIFMFNYWKGENHSELRSFLMTEKSQIICKRIRSIWKEYQSKIDWKFPQESYESKNSRNLIINTPEKERFLQQKTLELILHESERFVLCRHISAIAELISAYFQENNRDEQSGEMEQNHKERKCPIVFYRKIIFVCKMLLKEPIKYELIETKLKQLQPKFLQFLQEKGAQYLSRQIHHQKQKTVSPNLNKSQYSTYETNQPIIKKDLFFNKYQHEVSFKSYLSKMINYLQIKIILSRRQPFSLSFGDKQGKRKSFHEFTKRSQALQKSRYLEDLQKVLPKLVKHVKSESDLEIVIKSFSYSVHKKLLSAKPLNQQLHNQYTTEDFMLMIINELMVYESQQNFINYFYDQEPVLKTICDQIQAFKNILQILGWINLKLKNQNEKGWFFKSLNEEEINMQILRLCMRKIEVHFKLKKSEKDSSKERIKRNIDIKRSVDLEETSKFLKKIFHSSVSPYYQNQRVGQFLKNAEICTKYIDFICENYKVTEQFTTSIGEVDPEYKEIFSYLCEQTWKKTLFNGENNIIFFKSKPITYNCKPYTYVRKRNVTMKYMIKILREFKINITFLHLTKNNFNYIERDKNQNPNCKIKYLVLTVDTEIKQKDQMFLIFEDEKSIMHQSVKFEQFLGMMNKVVVDFIIVMGKNAILLADKLSTSLHGHPIVIGIQSPIYNLANFVKYTEPKVIDERDELQSNLSFNRTSQNDCANQIYEYMNLESYHCMLDMIVCSLITDMVNLPYKKSSRSRNFQQAYSQVLCTKDQINKFLQKSRSIAKQIMVDKWPKAQEIQIEFEVFIQQNTNLRRNYSSISSIETTESIQLTQRLSSRDSIQCIKYFPFFQKGSIVDNTTKIYESQLESEEYYESVNRNKKLYTIIKFIQQPGRRIVQIFGSKGAGKTSFLKQICWMNFIYRTFKDGVFIIDVENLSKSSQTILQNIEIVYKQSKLFSLMQDIDTYPKNQHLTILLALDNLDLSAIRQNSDFFERIRGKPICVLYSTNETNLENELEKYFRIHHHPDYEKHKNNGRMQDDDLIHQHNASVSKHKQSSDKRSSSHHSYSMELQSKKSIQQSETTSDNLQKQEWSYLQVDINVLNKNALFNIALSYLKKQEFKTLKMGMYEFIRDYFAGFVEQVIQQVSCQHSMYSSQQLNSMGMRRNSQQHSILHQQGSIELERSNSEGGSLAFRRIRSSVHSSQNQVNNFENQTSSNLPKLLKLMNEYFKNLTVQKVVIVGESSLENGEQAQKIPLIQSLDGNILNEKKDTRLWFYQNCFEELTKQINAYDFLEVAFH